MSQPFTYYLFHRPTGRKYYGVRYAKNCHPRDLWTTYFSSSSRIKALIQEHGEASFDVEVRKTFETKDEAMRWENRVLQRLKVVTRSDWLNCHDSLSPPCSEDFKRYMSALAKERGWGKNLINYHTPENHAKAGATRKRNMTDEQRQRISQSIKATFAIRPPKPWTEERRAKMKKTMTGRVMSESAKQKMRIAASNRTPEHQAKLNARPVSEATKEKRSKIAKERGSTWTLGMHTPEAHAKSVETRKGRPSPLRGRVQSKEFCQKVSEALKGRTFSLAHREKLRQAALIREARKKAA